MTGLHDIQPFIESKKWIKEEVLLFCENNNILFVLNIDWDNYPINTLKHPIGTMTFYGLHELVNIDIRCQRNLDYSVTKWSFNLPNTAKTYCTDTLKEAFEKMLKETQLEFILFNKKVQFF